MATIIDSLLVTLGLDSSGFKKGVKEVSGAQSQLKQQSDKDSKDRKIQDKEASDAQRARAKELQEVSKKSADSIRQIRNQAIGLIALFTGGIGLTRFASETIATAASVGRLSQNIGESTQTIIGWQRAFENVGGTAEEANESITKASNAIGAFKSGRASPEIQGFLQMGGSISGGELNSATSFKLAQAELIKKVIKERGSQVAMFQAQSFMGIGQNEFNLLRQGSGDVGKQVGSLGAGSGINERSARAAAQMQVRMNRLKHEFEDTGQKIVIALFPAMEKLMGYFEKLAVWIQNHSGDIAKFIDEAVKDLEKFMIQANKFAEAVGGWKNVLEGLLALKFASLLGGLTSILGAVTAIGSAAEIAGMAIAGLGGFKLGTMLYDNYIAGTSFGDTIGATVAGGLSLFGNEEAKGAFLKNNKPFNSNLSSPARSSGSNSSNIKSDSNIENINIFTQATDAAGIFRDARPAAEKYMFVPQANSGVR